MTLAQRCLDLRLAKSGSHRQTPSGSTTLTMKCNRPPRFLVALALGLLLMALVAAQSNVPIDSHGSVTNPAEAAPPRQLAFGPAPAVKFAHAAAYPSGGFYASSIAIADLNGDGKSDLVVANLCQASDGQSNCSAGGVVGVLLE